MKLPFSRRSHKELHIPRPNPFLQPGYEEPTEDPIIEIDLPSDTCDRHPMSGRKYLAALEEGAHRFPWFHEFPIAPAEDIANGLRERSVPAIRRVLASHLGGPPVHEIASRIPTSRSTVYKIIRELYLGADLATLTEWGLVRIWDIPVITVDRGSLPDGYYLEYDSAPTVCLVCHRVLGQVTLEEARYDYSIVTLPRELHHTADTQKDLVRAHLFAHFPMFGRPQPNERKFSNPAAVRYFTGEKNANRWIDLMDPSVVRAAVENRHKTLPIVPDRTPTAHEFRMFYRSLLKGSSK